MKEYNIALAGTFDVENYGDLMFPEVFDRAMKKRDLKFNLFLFSPSDKAKEALNESRMVYSFKDFEKLNDKYNFDALIIGGGALIHYRCLKVRFPDRIKREEYYNVHSWISLMYLASKNNIKIIFNLPQVPFEIPDELKNLTKIAFDQIDYFAVRDSFSKKYIEGLYSDNEKKPNIKVFPDTVCLVDELWDYALLEKLRKKKLGFDDKYMVFHFQYTEKVSEELFEELSKVVYDAKNKGLKVVLLPIGYTHGDEIIMKDFNKRCGGLCYFPNEKLTIEDMTAILSGCEYYVGMSFHGAIVSMSFGKYAFSVNHTLKNIEMYKTYNMSDNLAESYEELLNKIDEEYCSKQSKKFPKEKISKMVNIHFDNLYDVIKRKKIKKKTPEIFLGEVFSTISRLEARARIQSEEICSTERRYEDVKKELKNSKDDIKKIRSSRAFKIGCVLMFLPHKIMHLIRK